MSDIVIILNYFSVVATSVVVVFFMLVLGEYIAQVMFLNNKRSFHNVIKYEFKKMILFISMKKTALSQVSFLGNYLLFVISYAYLSLFISESNTFFSSYIHATKAESFFFITLVFLIYLSRFCEHVFNNTRIDLGKYIVKNIAILTPLLLNFSYIYILVNKVGTQNYLIIIFKFIFFINTVISVYIFDSYSKHNKNGLAHDLIGKFVIYFLLMGAFVMINSSKVGNDHFLNYFYYSISIILIDSLKNFVSYFINYIKLKQSLVFIYRYLIVYYVVTFLVFIGVYFVL